MKTQLSVVTCLGLACLMLRVQGRVSGLESAPNSASTDTGCPSEFLGRCRCGPAPYGPKSRIQYVTNCTDTGFQEVHMLKTLPPETEVLIFTGNEVFNLPVNLFGQDGLYPNLHTMDLSDNRIQGIRGRTFHTVNSVRTLILDNNDLYLVNKDHHPRMFSNFEQLEELRLRNAFTDKQAGSLYLANLADTFRESELLRLRKLDLSENGLDSFQDSRDIFCSLPELEELDLSRNKLTGLDDVSLNCLEHVRKLDLSVNRLTSLSNATLTTLDKVARVNVSANPFRCDCLLHDTLVWLHKNPTRVTDMEGLVCIQSAITGTAGPVAQTLTAVREEELPCPARQETQVHAHLQASYTVLALVLLVFSVLLVVVLYRNRSLVSGLASSCTTPIRNKLNYSSLDKREEAEMEV